MLHTVNKSPFQNGSLDSCFRFTKEGDVVLLLEDGVFAAVAGTSVSAAVEKAMETHEVCAISADIKARGLNNLLPGVKVIDYGDFVDLVDQHKVHSWL